VGTPVDGKIVIGIGGIAVQDEAVSVSIRRDGPRKLIVVHEALDRGIGRVEQRDAFPGVFETARELPGNQAERDRRVAFDEGRKFLHHHDPATGEQLRNVAPSEGDPVGEMNPGEFDGIGSGQVEKLDELVVVLVRESVGGGSGRAVVELRDYSLRVTSTVFGAWGREPESAT
jgi:hypothetical protein